MNSNELKSRTKKFALRVLTMLDSLPKNSAGRTVSNQLAKSATSVGANYRAACMARSKAEFVSKIRIVIEESDECCYWLEIIMESKMLKENLISPLYKEAKELTAIFVSSAKTASSKKLSIINSQ